MSMIGPFRGEFILSIYLSRSRSWFLSLSIRLLLLTLAGQHFGSTDFQIWVGGWEHAHVDWVQCLFSYSSARHGLRRPVIRGSRATELFEKQTIISCFIHYDFHVLIEANFEWDCKRRVKGKFIPKVPIVNVDFYPTEKLWAASQMAKNRISDDPQSPLEILVYFHVFVCKCACVSIH